MVCSRMNLSLSLFLDVKSCLPESSRAFSIVERTRRQYVFVLLVLHLRSFITQSRIKSIVRYNFYVGIQCRQCDNESHLVRSARKDRWLINRARIPALKRFIWPDSLFLCPYVFRATIDALRATSISSFARTRVRSCIDADACVCRHMSDARRPSESKPPWTIRYGRVVPRAFQGLALLRIRQDRDWRQLSMLGSVKISSD